MYLYLNYEYDFLLCPLDVQYVDINLMYYYEPLSFINYLMKAYGTYYNVSVMTLYELLFIPDISNVEPSSLLIG